MKHKASNPLILKWCKLRAIYLHSNLELVGKQCWQVHFLRAVLMLTVRRGKIQVAFIWESRKKSASICLWKLLLKHSRVWADLKRVKTSLLLLKQVRKMLHKLRLARRRSRPNKFSKLPKLSARSKVQWWIRSKAPSQKYSMFSKDPMLKHLSNPRKLPASRTICQQSKYPKQIVTSIVSSSHISKNKNLLIPIHLKNSLVDRFQTLTRSLRR